MISLPEAGWANAVLVAGLLFVKPPLTMALGTWDHEWPDAKMRKKKLFRAADLRSLVLVSGILVSLD